jgi:hypothetical protein
MLENLWSWWLTKSIMSFTCSTPKVNFKYVLVKFSLHSVVLVICAVHSLALLLYWNLCIGHLYLCQFKTHQILTSSINCCSQIKFWFSWMFNLNCSFLCKNLLCQLTHLSSLTQWLHLVFVNNHNQVREFEFDPTTMGRQLEELERLQCDKDHLHKILQQWCYASYGEVTHSLSNVLSNIKDLCLSI